MRGLWPEPTVELDAVGLEHYYHRDDRDIGDRDRPYLRANFVISLDGAVEVGGRSAPLGSQADRAVFMTLRALCDVILVGAGTVRAEGYGEVSLDLPARQRRLERARRAGRAGDSLPPIAVVSASGETGGRSRLFAPLCEIQQNQPRPIVITCEAASSRWRATMSEVAEVMVCGDDKVDLSTALRALGERGCSEVLCEGGPTLFSSLLTDGLVDEVCLSYAPLLAGTGRIALTDGLSLSDPARLELSHLLHGEGFLFARYATKRGG